jgi:hypothetical protein
MNDDPYIEELLLNLAPSIAAIRAYREELLARITKRAKRCGPQPIYPACRLDPVRRPAHQPTTTTD